MSPIRVLVVDDAVVVRKLVSDALGAVPDIEVCGVASNGRIALAKVAQLHPDLVTLDVEMPVMDGLATLEELRRLHPRLPVVMFSTLTERGAKVTVDALVRGANDYVPKPANVGGVSAAQQAIREHLVPKIKALVPRGASGSAATADRRGAPPRREPVGVVVIGVSTGGPAALAQLIPALPAELPAPVLICQHMPATFTGLLAARLDAASPSSVREARSGTLATPGSIAIAPGGQHLEVRRIDSGLELVTHDETPENSCRPSADVLFRSAAAACGGGVLAVVMTGMGRDGAVGARTVHEAGGTVLAQDRASSVVWGMPAAVTDAGLADAVLPLDQLAPTIAQQASGHRAAAR